jgi:hypothetical protein
MTTDTKYSTERCDSLIPYPGNARRGDVGAIRESLENLGQYKPVVVQLSTRYVLAGNHTLAAHLDLGWDEIEVYWVDCDDETAKRINLVDNRSADLGEYDSRALADLLRSLEGDYTATGYDGDYLSELLEQMANEALDRDGEGEDDGDDDGAETDAGTLLALTDVSVAEPRHQPTLGSRWQVGRHLLIVAKIADEHHLWRDDLDGRVFAPYPEPYLTVSDKAQEAPLLLVQPNKYLAGHLLDKHEAIYPGTVEKLS